MPHCKSLSSSSYFIFGAPHINLLSQRTITFFHNRTQMPLNFKTWSHLFAFYEACLLIGLGQAYWSTRIQFQVKPDQSRDYTPFVYKGEYKFKHLPDILKTRIKLFWCYPLLSNYKSSWRTSKWNSWNKGERYLKIAWKKFYDFLENALLMKTKS